MNQGFAAAVTVLALGQTGGSTGGSNSGIGHFVMTQSSNFTGFRMITTRASALFLTLFGAGRSLRLCPGAHIMAQSGNDFLMNQGFAAAVTVLAFGQTGGSTSGGDSGINHFVMTQSGNNSLSYQNLITYRAVFALS